MFKLIVWEKGNLNTLSFSAGFSWIHIMILMIGFQYLTVTEKWRVLFRVGIGSWEVLQLAKINFQGLDSHVYSFLWKNSLLKKRSDVSLLYYLGIGFYVRCSMLLIVLVWLYKKVDVVFQSVWNAILRGLTYTWEDLVYIWFYNWSNLRLLGRKGVCLSVEWTSYLVLLHEIIEIST